MPRSLPPAAARNRGPPPLTPCSCRLYNLLHSRLISRQPSAQERAGSSSGGAGAQYAGPHCWRAPRGVHPMRQHYGDIVKIKKCKTVSQREAGEPRPVFLPAFATLVSGGHSHLTVVPNGLARHHAAQGTGVQGTCGEGAARRHFPLPKRLGCLPASHWHQRACGQGRQRE